MFTMSKKLCDTLSIFSCSNAHSDATVRVVYLLFKIMAAVVIPLTYTISHSCDGIE